MRSSLLDVSGPGVRLCCRMPYRLKAKCLGCNLHFIVYTWDRDKHSRQTLYCPECGRHDGNFLTWRDEDAGEIHQEVPGTTPATQDMDVTLADIPIEKIKDERDACE